MNYHGNPAAMRDYEAGRKASREGKPFQENPYQGWFRRCRWEMGWQDEQRLIAECKEKRSKRLPRRDRSGV
ncbi:hypothetical protein [Hyphomicrobium sp. CS1GBMeth3]|uniref:hypothetical protein n=1 Tax=Hyphomicrobium sp. CS1GBMeth3 TaxID=1892845 RepID=UPI00093013D9|nr:hypothetical protein [Hyphomicrobium sp. CS1GBMeth3]